MKSSLLPDYIESLSGMTGKEDVLTAILPLHRIVTWNRILMEAMMIKSYKNAYLQNNTNNKNIAQCFLPPKCSRT